MTEPPSEGPIVRRSFAPYIQILEDFLGGRIDALAFRTRTIQQYDILDARVWWSREWNEELSAVLERMDADAEVYYPEAPEESYITLEKLLESCRDNLRRLRAVASLERGGPTARS